MKQYSSVQHFIYNRFADGFSQKQIKDQIKSLNNIQLMNSWFIQCAFYDIPQKEKVIFGGKKNFFNRLKGKITKEQFKLNKLSSIYSIGEIVNKSVKSNRFFHLEQELDKIIFKPNKYTKEIKIGYKLDLNYVYICFEETDIQKFETKQIKNRILALDLNPNYIGWSIVDWKSENQFKVVKTGIYSIKDLNDKDFDLKNKHLDSSSPERIYLTNKRNYEVLQISKNIINKAIYYKCQMVSIEDLKINSDDKNKGKKFNKLVNNLWNRSALVNNLQKRCNIFNIKLLKVKPEYSSFIGNFLYRSLNLPDMILSSIEIGRRAYEFYNQYISKVKEIKKNIVRPNLTEFRELYLKSLEEFELQPIYKDLIDLYYEFKKSKLRYRLSIDQFNLQFSSLNSSKSNVSAFIFS